MANDAQKQMYFSGDGRVYFDGPVVADPNDAWDDFDEPRIEPEAADPGGLEWAVEAVRQRYRADGLSEEEIDRLMSPKAAAGGPTEDFSRRPTAEDIPASLRAP